MEANLSIMVTVVAAFSPLLVALLGFVTWLYTHERERREEVERQLSEHKYKAYVSLIEIFFDLMKGVRAGKPVPEHKLISKMIDANKELVLYGSDDVVRIYQEWLKEARTGVGLTGLDWFGDLILAIRRDMGHAKTKITAQDILRQFILDYDEAKLKELLEAQAKKES